MQKFGATVREFKFQFSIAGNLFETTWFAENEYPQKLAAAKSAAVEGCVFVKWREFRTTGYEEVK